MFDSIFKNSFVGLVSAALAISLNLSSPAQSETGNLDPGRGDGPQYASQSPKNVQQFLATSQGAARPIVIELSLRACRDACQDFSLLYDAYQISLLTCMIAGQREVAAWAESHPGWRVERWSCQFLNQDGMKA